MTAIASMPTQNTIRSCTTRAPAKLNLSLEILGRRPDGFHDLRSLIIGAGLYDDLSCTQSEQPGISIRCDASGLSTADNLALRAVQMLLEKLHADADVVLDLQKRIPIGAGLGGGSSNAAAALVACNRMLGDPLSRAELAAIGAVLGSDVPLFFHLPSALIEGRGERAGPAGLAWSGWALLVLPPICVSTASVYAARLSSDSAPADPRTIDALCEAKTAGEISELTFNQLEPALFRGFPQVRTIFDAITSFQLGRVRVSGSGSAMYLLFDDPGEARHASAQIELRMPQMKTAVVPAPVGEVPVECVSI